MRLHEANCRWFDRTCNAFYDGVLKDMKRRTVFIEEFRTLIRWPIYLAVKNAFGAQVDAADISLEWNEKDNLAEVTLVGAENVVACLNENSGLKSKVSSAFKDVYRYAGEFRFAIDDIPF